MIAFYISLLIPLLGYVVVLYQIPKDMFTAKNQHTNAKNKWQRLNIKGKRFVIISFIVAIVAEGGLILKGPDRIPSITVRIDTKQNTVFVPKIIKDTIHVKEKSIDNSTPPVLDIIDDSVKFIGTVDKPKITFYLKSVNDKIVYKSTAKFVLLYLAKDTIFFSKVIPIENRLLLMAYGTKALYYAAQLVVDTNSTMACPFYVFYKTTYYDKEIGGKLQPPLRRLYIVNTTQRPKQIKDFSIKPVDTAARITILKKELIRKNLW